MLRKYYNHVAHRDEDKKDADDKGGDGKFPSVENVFFIFRGPTGVITVVSSFEHAYECDVECVEHAEALAMDEALVADLQRMANEAMESKQRHADSFEAAEGAKDIPLNPNTPDGKVLKISATLDNK
ncbi:uncharacterized protein LOC120662929 [Panicum virgatum]|uniref:uncharacterized protein LOC120662929 n=1 Tax=Panicum virgatum TaxID=38727 RepID=UPI0019D547D4|nr:uncharacterized protein LOC120662929 [Panicum virgatum]